MNNTLLAKNLTQTQKEYVINILSRAMESLDLTKTQYENIESAYNGVGAYLANSENLLLKNISIYPQGSVRLNTAVKPINKDQYDIDLICYLPEANGASKDEVCQAIKNRLNEHETYKKMLVDLPRGFRINYALDYHLDLTPGRDYTEMKSLDGHPLWIVDKKNGWKESNPKGFAEWFIKSGERVPTMLTVSMESRLAMDSLEPLPNRENKTLLSLIVQILKRHRDEWSSNLSDEMSKFRPISIIITTLVTKAYNLIIEEDRTYMNYLDIIIDILYLMPSFIEVKNNDCFVENPAMLQENFAEKWNRVEDDEGLSLRNSFESWRLAGIHSFNQLVTVVGEDNLYRSLGDSFGHKPVERARQVIMEHFNKARKQNQLSIVGGTGAVLATSISSGSSVTSKGIVSNSFYGDHIPVRSNNFFGDN